MEIRHLPITNDKLNTYEWRISLFFFFFFFKMKIFLISLTTSLNAEYSKFTLKYGNEIMIYSRRKICWSIQTFFRLEPIKIDVVFVIVRGRCRISDVILIIIKLISVLWYAIFIRLFNNKKLNTLKAIWKGIP